jgi:hypothetical protein
MKTKIVFCLISVLLLLALNSCNENSTQTPKVSNEIMSLSTGNYWIGQYKAYSASASNFNQLISSRYDTLKVVSDTTIDGMHWYKLNEGICLRKSESGLDARPFAIHPFLFSGCKFPAAVGDTFKTEKMFCIVGTCDYGFALDSGYSYYQIDKTDTVISVPKGNFHCYEIKKYSYTTSEPEPKATCPIYYLSINVGLVKLISSTFGKNGLIYPANVWELVDYKLY